MNSNSISSAVKEVVLSIIASLLFFSLMAGQSAASEQSHLYHDTPYAQIQTVIEEVSQAETLYLSKQKTLEKKERKFESGEISMSEFFIAQVELSEAESFVMQSRTKLLVALANLKKSETAELAFHQSL